MTPPLLAAQMKRRQKIIYLVAAERHTHARTRRHTATCTPTPPPLQPRGERGDERSTHFSQKAGNERSHDHRSAFRSRDKRRHVTPTRLSSSLPPFLTSAFGPPRTSGFPAFVGGKYFLSLSGGGELAVPSRAVWLHFQLTVVRLLHKHIDHAAATPPPSPSASLSWAQNTHPPPSSSSGLVFIVFTCRWMLSFYRKHAAGLRRVSMTHGGVLEPGANHASS